MTREFFLRVLIFLQLGFHELNCQRFRSFKLHKVVRFVYLAFTITVDPSYSFCSWCMSVARVSCWSLDPGFANCRLLFVNHYRCLI